MVLASNVASVPKGDDTVQEPTATWRSRETCSAPWHSRMCWNAAWHNVCWKVVVCCFAQCVLKGSGTVTLISVCCFSQWVLEGCGMVLRTVCAGRLWIVASHSVCWKVVVYCFAQCVLEGCGILLHTVCAVEVDGWKTAWHSVCCWYTVGCCFTVCSALCW
jgi:hypothetical protein